MGSLSYQVTIEQRVGEAHGSGGAAWRRLPVGVLRGVRSLCGWNRVSKEESAVGSRRTQLLITETEETGSRIFR